MDVDEDLLFGLYAARLDDLREMAVEQGLSKAGNVEQLRARLIDGVALKEVDLSGDSLQEMQNKELGHVLGLFGIKRSGSIKEKRQRLYLHLNHDPKKLNPESVADSTRDQLHELCKALELPRSGTKQQLFARVAGVLASHEGGWGKVKKSLKRGRPKRSTSAAPALRIDLPEPPAPAPAPVMDADEAAELAAMIQASIDAVDVDALSEVLESDETPAPEEPEGIVEPEPVVLEAPGRTTIDEGAGVALIELEARLAELHSHIREFLLISVDPDAHDITAFVEDLGGQDFRIDHTVVRDRILDEISAMASRRDAENDASGAAPGSWRERRALRRLEECRPALLDLLEGILDGDGADLALARVRFESAASEAGLDLELPGISGRVHGLFDLQVSLRTAEADVDPVTARRQHALDTLYRGSQDVSADALRTLQRFEERIENFERIVETLVRRAEGRFGPVEHALLVRFLERRGWDVGHPEVRPRVIATAGVLAAAMGYIESADVPGLPTSVSLDPDKVSDVVDNLRGLLTEMGRAAPTEASVAHGIPAAAADQAEEIAHMGRVRNKLDAADALLGRLTKGFESETSE